MIKQDLKTLSLDEMGPFVKGLGWPRYRADQILRWIYKSRAANFDRMTDLPARDRTMLKERAFVSQIQLLTTQTSVDGTRKLLFSLDDGNRIEAVLIPDPAVGTVRLGRSSGERLTLCISTQVGCTLDCSFCLTGRMGLKRNLRAHEIVDQFLVTRSILEETEGEDITHIVLMGMGEPLANFHPVLEAIHRLSSPRGIGFSPRRITLSTAGLVPQIRMLGTLALKINLAVSLNATTDKTRNELMGTINRKYPLTQLLKACREYPLPRGRRLTFEYVLIQGVNDSSDDAYRLINHLKGIRCKVNLIPYNEHPGAAFRRPKEEDVLHFQEILKGARIDTFIRKSKGRDILAACGQLETAAITVRSGPQALDSTQPR